MFEIYKPTYNETPRWLTNVLTVTALLVAATVVLNPQQRHPHPTLASFSIGAGGMVAVLIAYWPWRRKPTLSNQRTLVITANTVMLLVSILRSHLLA